MHEMKISGEGGLDIQNQVKEIPKWQADEIHETCSIQIHQFSYNKLVLRFQFFRNWIKCPYNTQKASSFTW